MEIENIVKEAIEKYTADNPHQSFYTVVPSSVLYDMNLTNSEFRLLCILLSFLTINGEAYPSNKYLSEKFGITKENISKHIKSLSDKNYIEIEYEIVNKEVKKRIVKPTEVLLKIIRGIIKNNKGGIIENNKYNNISINTINNNKKNADPFFESEFIWSNIKGLGLDTWMEWCNYRKEIHKPITLSTAKAQLKKLSKSAEPKEMIRQSIENGWQGLFDVKQPAKTKSGGMIVQKDKPQYTKDEWNVLINETCKTAYERTELYSKYNLDSVTGLWIKK